MWTIKPKQQLQSIRGPVRLSPLASNTQAAREWAGGLRLNVILLWKGREVNESYTCLSNILKLTCPGKGGLIRALA